MLMFRRERWRGEFVCVCMSSPLLTSVHYNWSGTGEVWRSLSACSKLLECAEVSSSWLGGRSLSGRSLGGIGKRVACSEERLSSTNAKHCPLTIKNCDLELDENHTSSPLPPISPPSLINGAFFLSSSLLPTSHSRSRLAQLARLLPTPTVLTRQSATPYVHNA